MTEPAIVRHLSTAELDAGDARRPSSPVDVGTLEMIVRRPDVDQREVLHECRLAVGEGVVGDNYLSRPNPKEPGGLAHPEAQINVMNSRILDTIASGDRSRWPLAGDQFLVDFDLSVDNLPVGARLAIGTAVIEVAAKPHNGCSKFADRFGQDAARWVNRDKEQRRRGLNAMVVQAGVVRTGDTITKLP